jgi:hypothetical protein
MDPIVLRTRRGDFVATVMAPSTRGGHDIIQYHGRYFVRYEGSIYREGTMFVADATRPITTMAS